MTSPAALSDFRTVGVGFARVKEDALVCKAQTFVGREVSTGVGTAGDSGGVRTSVRCLCG
jgi:hypothetical protein